MTATPTVPPEVAGYLAAVREALSDLAPQERDDLLVEVEASLLETASESDAPISARLGPPEEFAAELRAAAGLQPNVEGPATSRFSRRARAVVEAGTHVAARLRPLLRELTPIWWVARARTSPSPPSRYSPGPTG